MFFTYIIKSLSSGSFYIGSTSNLDARIARHNQPSLAPPSTRNKGYWILVYSEAFPARSDAIRREKHLKSWKNHRLNFAVIFPCFD